MSLTLCVSDTVGLWLSGKRLHGRGREGRDGVVGLASCVGWDDVEVAGDWVAEW